MNNAENHQTSVTPVCAAEREVSAMAQMDPAAIIQKCNVVATMLKALANPQRLMIVCHLAQGDKTVTELEQLCLISQSSVSQHLTRMRLEGFIASRREGNFIYYRITDPKVLALIQTLHRLFC